MQNKSWLTVIVPVVTIALLGLFMVTPAYFGAQWGLYDLFLGIKPAVPEREEILLLDVDDLAIERVGVWPWSRSLMANGLLTMGEFGVEHVLFDIEYIEESPLGVNSDVLNQEIPSVVESEFGSIATNVQELVNAIQEGQIPIEDADDFAAQLANLAEQSEQQVMSSIQEIARNHDRFLGQAAGVFGRAFFTVGMRPDPDDRIPQELREFTREHIAVDEIDEVEPTPHVAEEIKPAILPVLRGAAGAGFPNVVVDPDGVRRRVSLF